ncbi:MAG TPA: flavodoxin [Massilibacterium sp.]|nr:flavodoxin [Massilibacterium sp.]
MSKTVIIFASMGGNTEEIASIIAQKLKEASEDVTTIDMMDSPVVTILNEYDQILLGAYTWGDGELPDEYLDFYDDLDTLDLTGKKAAAFGSGDTGYPSFCGAVDLLSEKLKERGAEIVCDGLKVELFPEDEEAEKCVAFAEALLKNSTVTNG